jgi:type I restriction enzyme S subunit
MSAPEAELGDVAEFIRGITFKPDDVVPVDTPGAAACMRTKNVQAELDLSDVWGIPESLVGREDQYLMPGDMLVSSANSWNLVGKCCWVPNLPWRSTFGGFISVLRSNPAKVDPRYLFHWFNSDRTQATVRSFGQQTTNISNLNVDRCLRLKLRLPPLPEQQRIAEILDKAEVLRAKRRAALAQLDTLTQSIFLDMFGDPVTNPKGWQRVRFSDLLQGIEGGWSPTCLDRPAAAEEWGVLKLGAVTWCEYDETQNKALPPELDPRPELEVCAGDLLFSRKNTYELVAACALVRTTRPRLLLPDLVFRLRLRPDAPVAKEFLHQLLIYPTKRREVQKLAGGSAGSMPNISKGRLETLPIEVPPVREQYAFADRVSAISQSREAQRVSKDGLDVLHTSLQHRAFRGEL